MKTTISRSDAENAQLDGSTALSPQARLEEARNPVDARQRFTKMSIGKKMTLKQVLQDECIPALQSQWSYYNVATVRTWLNQRGVHCPQPTLNRYLYSLSRAGLISGAGRGWYSSLAKAFTLNRGPVSSLVQQLSKAFPLVTFSCWSTEQVKGAMHHLLSRFVSFVNVEADSMETVWEHLRDAGWDAWLNPRGTEAARFTVRERTLVVRRESRKSPSRERFAPIEKLLVELCFEARDLNLMEASEFHAMLRNLAGTRRIQVGTLLKYAGDRKLSPDALLGATNPLTPPFQKRRL